MSNPHWLQAGPSLETQFTLGRQRAGLMQLVKEQPEKVATLAADLLMLVSLQEHQLKAVVKHVADLEAVEHQRWLESCRQPMPVVAPMATA